MIPEQERLLIEVMAESHLPQVVSQHLKVLGHTFNASLGAPYLLNLYQQLVRSPLGLGFVAVIDRQVKGFVSATADSAQFQRELFWHLSASSRLTLLRRLLTPRGFGQFVITLLVNRPVTLEGQRIQASLLTLGVDSSALGQGVGRSLVNAISAEMRRRGIARYHLNTLVSDPQGQAFYRALGFQLWRVRFGNAIFIHTSGGGRWKVEG